MSHTRRNSIIAITTTVIIAFFNLTYSSGEQPWRSTTGPEGGSVSVISSDGTTVFAGLRGGGIWRSLNGGRNWQPAVEGAPQRATYSSIVHTKSAVFASTHGQGIFKSENNGATWKDVTFDLPVPRIESLGTNGDNVFAIDRDFTSRIWLLDEGSSSWTEITTPGPFLFIASANGALFGGGGFFNVFRSDDGGESWKEADDGLPSFASPTAFASLDDSIFVSTGELSSQEGLFRSDDNGESWVDASNGLPNEMVMNLVAIGSRLFASTESSEIYVSGDLGNTWQQLGTALPLSSFDAVFGTDGHRLLVGTSSGVLAFDEELGWSMAGSGFRATNVSQLVSQGSNLYATVSSEDLIFKSDDGGRTWLSFDQGLPQFLNIKSAFAGSNDRVFLGTRTSGIYRSTDSGETWARHGSGIPTFLGPSGLEFEPINAMAELDGDIYAATGGAFHIGEHGQGGSPFPSGKGVLKSSDSGNNWSPARVGLPISGTDVFGETFFRPVDSLIAYRGVLYAGVNDRGVYRSTNGGNNWSRIPGLTGTVNHLVGAGDNIIAVARNVSVQEIHVTDIFNPGFALTTGGPEDRFITAIASDDDRVLMAASIASSSQLDDTLLYESFDDGVTWQPATEQPDVPSIGAMTVLEDGIYAATGGYAVWTQQAGLLGDVNGDDQLNTFDVVEFNSCFSGPLNEVTSDCFGADTDGDNDVDLADFANVQLAIGESATP